VADTTDGFLTTGAVVLDLDKVPGSPPEFTLTFQSPGGFARPPRVLRIEPSVVPIEQTRRIVRETHEATGRPGWTFDLEETGLRYAASEDPIVLEVAESSGLETWSRQDRLLDQGPSDAVYQLDTNTGRVAFGNGVNGRIPPTGAQVMASYTVSDAEQGSVARNRRWRVPGFPGSFGVNPDPVGGGAAPSDSIAQRREARRSSREDHALVSSADLVAAAKALPLLEVVRAWVVPLRLEAPQTGVVTLVAMRARPTDEEPATIPETPRWREAIRRRLAPRVPLGTRLVVAAPRYVGFFIQATVETAQGRDPKTVETEIRRALQARLALAPSTPGRTPRRSGVPLTERDLAAWIRKVDGVQQVTGLTLRTAAGRVSPEILVPPGGLPRWDAARSSFDVRRPGAGRMAS
jgi:predicted phage baseplate assembly protein